MATLVRWNPVREMAAFDLAFEQIWNNPRNQSTTRALALNVHETDNGYTVVTALPGVNAGDIIIQMHDNVLTISGETKSETKTEGETARALMIERSVGKFSRSIRLPMPVQNDGIDATLENGVLTLTLPKHEAAQPRQIQVKIGNGQPETTGEVTNA